LVKALLAPQQGVIGHPQSHEKQDIASLFFCRSSSRYSFLSGLSVTSRMGMPTPSLMTDELLTLRSRRCHGFLRADPRNKRPRASRRLHLV